MRVRTLLALWALAVLSGTGYGASWYVAPTGNDSANGSLQAPFATIQRAQASAAPGDTVYLRGGIYRADEKQVAKRIKIFAQFTLLDKSGLPDKPITYTAYRDEKPIFDFSGLKPAGMRVTAFCVTGSWLRLVGIDVQGVQVTMTGHTQSICFENSGSNNLFDRLTMHDGQAIGIYMTRGSNNLFLNCDAWNNWDSTSEGGKGGNVDGFGAHPAKGGVNNVFRNCRAWFNSDDGFDCINAHEAVRFEGCWALYNGYSPGFVPRADGNGFKAGGYAALAAERLPKPIPRHSVVGCIAARNKASGFYANHHPGGVDWIGNSAFRNRVDFNMLGRSPDNREDIDGEGHLLRNNLSFGGGMAIARINDARCIRANNSFDRPLKLKPPSFEALDESALLQPRQRDGSLPVTAFLRPRPGAQLDGIGAVTP
jgi:hypothetical protein